MNAIVLKNTTAGGEPLEAVFLPEKGMTLISYRKGDTEVIDQSTKEIFEKTHEGLGPIIGPHFHARNPQIIPPIENESVFPHIANHRKEGITDPFLHGVGRYAPWQAEVEGNKISAVLSGKEIWRETELSYIEGQNFQMLYGVELTSNGLDLSLSVVSEFDSVVGIHFYYHLPEGTGKVIAKVQDSMIENNQKKKIPPEWEFASNHQLAFDLEKYGADFTFWPFPDPLHGEILLDAGSYKLLTSYSSDSAENSFQLYHPKGASFVCIEPISSQNPRRPNLTVSSVRIQLQIL